MTASSKTGTKVTLGLIAFGLAGGSAFMFVKLLVGELTPLQLTAGRIASAAIPLLAIMLLTGSRPRLSRSFLAGVTALALIDTIAPYTLIAWAALHVNSSSAAVLISTMPLFTTLIAARTARDEGITPALLTGLVTGFVGVAVLAGPQALQGGSTSAIGLLAVVAAAFLYAVGAVYSRTLMKHADAIGLSAVKLAIGTLVLVPFTLGIDGAGGYVSLSSEGWLGLILLGFVSTGLGRSLYQWIIAEAGSVRASLVTYIIPAVAIVLGWAVLHESISASTLGGAALIIGGVVSVMYGTQLKAAATAIAGLVTPKAAGSAVQR